MAQSRERRKQRAKQQARRPIASHPVENPRRKRLRRVVIAFLIVVGLAGILVITAPADEPSGRAPVG